MRRLAMVLVVVALETSTASAQWTRVSDVPAVNFYSVFTKGDTIVAGSDSTVFVSTDAGTTWTTTAKVVAGAILVPAVRIHKGRLYAGTLGQGVFVSNDLGTSWQGFNQGLVGGFANAQLFIMDLLPRGDTLYAATEGGGPWIRNLASAGGWSHYGNVLEPAQASNMEAVAASPTRLLACAGGNGDVYFRDPGDPDWTFDYLFGHNVAGLASQSAIWTGSSWLVGTNAGVFHSASGQSPWTYTDFGLHPTIFSSFALHDGVVFTSFASNEGTGVEYSLDDGASWNVLDRLPATFTYEIAVTGNTLYGGRVDGLFRRSIANVSVPPGTPPGLRFSIAGPHPIHDEARFRIELPEAARVRIDVFDLAGRRVAGGVDEALPAGPNEVSWRTVGLAAGVYMARVDAGGRTAALRFVRVP
jgi:photosystem II stability/assembly factor-like uncharacterized protein